MCIRDSVRSAYRDIPELGDAREAIRFYTAQAEKTWSEQSLYGKGEIALLMYCNGKKEVANTILAWLRKTATTTCLLYTSGSAIFQSVIYPEI